jgi:RNA-binding protein YhbY
MEPNGIAKQVLAEIARKELIKKEEVVEFLKDKVSNPHDVAATIAKDLYSRGLITYVTPIGESCIAITQKGMRQVQG